MGLWLAASAGFSVYLDNFASYNRVYGTLGAAVAFLVWAWLVNLALLVGVEVNRDSGGAGAPAPPGRPGAPGDRERLIGVHANRRATDARHRRYR